MTDKKEDWPKYLQELQQLQPQMSENMVQSKSGIVSHNGKLEPINDKQNLHTKDGAMIINKEDMSRAKRRKIERAEKSYQKRLGKMSEDRDYMNRMLKLDQSKTWLKDAQRVTRHKQNKINMWYDEELRMMMGSEKFNKIQAYITKNGKWPWWKRYIKCKIQHEANPYPWGKDHLVITVFGQIHASVTYVWDNK